MRFASNIRTFLLALVLGISVWVSAVSAADPDVVRPFPKAIPIEIVGQDPRLVITNELPTTMNVTIRAPQSVWETLTNEDDSVRAILDLTGLGAGEHIVKVQVQVSVRLTQVILRNPDTVTVNLESFSTKPLPLTLILSGQPAAGYQAGDATLATNEAVISGPESLVKQAVRARVNVNLDGARENIDEQVPIQIIDSKNEVMRGLTLNPETVQANVPISQQGGFRDVAVKVIVQGQVAAGYRLESVSVFPPIVTVTSDDPTVVNKLTGVVETQPLNLQDVKQDISTRLSLNLPKSVTLVGAQTVQVHVTVTAIQTSITLLNQPVNVIGLSEGLTVEAFPEAVDVIVSGPSPVLDVLPSGDVKVTVDVAGLGPGTYQLKPEADPANGNVTVESILPGTVEVVISIRGTPTPIPPTPIFTPGP